MSVQIRETKSNQIPDICLTDFYARIDGIRKVREGRRGKRREGEGGPPSHSRPIGREGVQREGREGGRLKWGSALGKNFSLGGNNIIVRWEDDCQCIIVTM